MCVFGGRGAIPFPLFKRLESMIKEYRAKTIIAFSVKVDGKDRRISFHAMTNGSSHYVTSDPKVACALERHRWFGDKFYLFRESGEVESVERAVVVESSATEEAEPDDGLEEKHFNNYEAARSWLVKTYGCRVRDIRSNVKTAAFATDKGYKLVINDG